MRITVVGEFYQESFALNVASAAEELGHVVTRFSAAPPRFLRRARLESLWSRARLLSPSANPVSAFVHRSFRSRVEALGAQDLVIVTYDFLSAEDVDVVKQVTGARVAFWFPDALSAWGRALFLNAPYDAIFLKDPYAVDQLTKFTSLPAYYLPECFNPASYAGFRRAGIAAKHRVDVTTAGNIYTYRVAALATLSTYRAKIWGHRAPAWIRTGPLGALLTQEYVADNEKARAFRGAKIVVNSLHPAEIWGVNARAFEIAGCGGFQLISWRPMLSQLFEDGEELVSYASESDLRAKIDEYLTRPMRRARVARAGRLRAMRDHTYALRLSLMIRTVYGEAAGYPIVRAREPERKSST